MTKFKPCIFIIITVARLTFINSETISNCECINFVNSYGQGNCKNLSTNKSDDRLCYVRVPSECSDVQNSSLFHDKQISWRACELHTKHIALKSKGAKNREISFYCILLSIFTKLTLSQGGHNHYLKTNISYYHQKQPLRINAYFSQSLFIQS